VTYPAIERNEGFGTYDAQEGDEVVTNRCRRRIPTTLVRMQPRLRALCVLPLALLLAACGASARPIQDPPTPVAAHCRSGSSHAVGSRRVAVAAVVRSRAVAYRRPGGRPFAHFGRLNVNGYPTFFRVLAAVRRHDCRASWYRVQLPLRPNGVTGFVRARSVQVASVRTRIVVDVSARRLTFYRSGRRVFSTPVAVGASATPTPTGSYYVNQRLIPADASGPYGPGALGISAFSTVLTGWTQGGPVAIHGTNEPWSIGHAVSNGCVRVRNPVLRRLFAATNAGTPVLIRQ
jgi:lipoprotein-anchoring transpeptidase ErfK/SrfK